MRRIGKSAMEPLQGCARLPPELVQARFVHEHDVGRCDDITEAPAQFPEVSRSHGFDGHRVIRALASQHAFMPRLRGRMDRDDRERLAERLSEHLQLCSAAQPFDDNALSVNPRQGALRPDSESMRLSLGVGHPSDRGVGDRKAPALGLFPNDIAHSNDGKAEILRNGEDLLLAASGHARDADDPHGVRGIGGLT